MSEDIICAHHLELLLGVLTSVPDPLEIFQELDSQVEERFGSMLGGNRERGLQFSVPEPWVGSDQVGQRVRTVVSIDISHETSAVISGLRWLNEGRVIYF